MGLNQALSAGRPVLCLFIYDLNILGRLTSKSDRRLDFIHQALNRMQVQLREAGSDLLTIAGKPITVFDHLLARFDVEEVFCNEDYEPYACTRDAEILEQLGKKKVVLKTFKDQCIFSKKDILKEDGSPYTIFTPYARKWKERLNSLDLAPVTGATESAKFLRFRSDSPSSLEDLGFRKTGICFSEPEISETLLGDYSRLRDYPGEDGTTRLGIHLRFGTVSVREMVYLAKAHSEAFLNELIWREFFMMIMWHFPRVAREAFRPQYNHIRWRNSEMEFKAWQMGRTGYPLVDAGMRQLSQTGFMHNRVRMVAASFLVKHLLIDWRWGEAWFAEKLDDFEQSSNNGNWQWVAGSGCDSAPYFRIFNPKIQQKKFDPGFSYIKRWIPEFGSGLYPPPIIDHRTARERAIKVYSESLRVIRRGELF